MKTHLKSFALASLILTALALSSCGSAMPTVASPAQLRRVSAAAGPVYSPQARFAAANYSSQGGGFRTGWNAYRYMQNIPSAYDLIATGLQQATLPFYSVGSSPSYQRQATKAYGHMAGKGHVGGMSLQDTMQ